MPLIVHYNLLKGNIFNHYQHELAQFHNALYIRKMAVKARPCTCLIVKKRVAWHTAYLDIASNNTLDSWSAFADTPDWKKKRVRLKHLRNTRTTIKSFA